MSDDDYIPPIGAPSRQINKRKISQVAALSPPRAARKKVLLEYDESSDPELDDDEEEEEDDEDMAMSRPEEALSELNISASQPPSSAPVSGFIIDTTPTYLTRGNLGPSMAPTLTAVKNWIAEKEQFEAENGKPAPLTGDERLALLFLAKHDVSKSLGELSGTCQVSENPWPQLYRHSFNTLLYHIQATTR